VPEGQEPTVADYFAFYVVLVRDSIWCVVGIVLILVLTGVLK
jgi:hypothetical protein